MNYPKEMNFLDQEMNFPAQEMNFLDQEMNFPDQKMNFLEMETNFLEIFEMEMNFPDQEMNFPEIEINCWREWAGHVFLVLKWGLESWRLFPKPRNFFLSAKKNMNLRETIPAKVKERVISQR